VAMNSNESTHCVIAIDGPAGAGKSTTAKKLAKRLGFVHLNSGALFRATALEALESGVPLDDDIRLSELARSLDFSFELDASGETIFFSHRQTLSERVASEEVSAAASRIAVLPLVREVILKIQREVAEHKDLVVEGRDAGTIVFPHAPFKFFLDASVVVRARRRYEQLISSASPAEHKDVKYEQVLREIECRDERDRTREIAPSVVASDAVLIDTSEKSPEEVVICLLDIVKSKGC